MGISSIFHILHFLLSDLLQKNNFCVIKSWFKSKMITRGESWGHLGQIETKISVGNHRQLSRRPKLDFDQIDIRSILHFLLSDFRRIFVSSSQFKSKRIIYGESWGHLGQIETNISMGYHRQLSRRSKLDFGQNEILSIFCIFYLVTHFRKTTFCITESY